MSTPALLEPSLPAASPVRTFAAVCAVNFGAMVSFYLLFPVAPLLAAPLGGAAAAGAVTGALMAATLVAEIASGPLQRLARPAVLLAGGLGLMAAPALFMAQASVGGLIGLCAIRGLGLGLLLVSGGAVVAQVLSPARRSAGLALFGGLSSLPGVIALPAAPWLLARLGASATAELGAVAALAVLPLNLLIAAPPCDGEGAREDGGNVWTLRGLAPLAALLGAAAATGICTSVLPLARPWAQPETIALALLANAVAALALRSATGWAKDATAQRRALAAGLVLSIVGLAAVGLSQNGIQLCAAMGILGGGFGLVQNPSFLLVLDRAPAGAIGMVSALWNFAYDAGLGLGAVVFGLAATRLSPSIVLLAVSAALALLLPVVARPARRAAT